MSLKIGGDNGRNLIAGAVLRDPSRSEKQSAWVLKGKDYYAVQGGGKGWSKPVEIEERGRPGAPLPVIVERSKSITSEGGKGRSGSFSSLQNDRSGSLSSNPPQRDRLAAFTPQGRRRSQSFGAMPRPQRRATDQDPPSPSSSRERARPKRNKTTKTPRELERERDRQREIERNQFRQHGYWPHRKDSKRALVSPIVTQLDNVPPLPTAALAAHSPTTGPHGNSPLRAGFDAELKPVAVSPALPSPASLVSVFTASSAPVSPALSIPVSPPKATSPTTASPKPLQRQPTFPSDTDTDDVRSGYASQSSSSLTVFTTRESVVTKASSILESPAQESPKEEDAETKEVEQMITSKDDEDDLEVEKETDELEAEEWTVDDAIDMYLVGFEDDVVSPVTEEPSELTAPTEDASIDAMTETNDKSPQLIHAPKPHHEHKHSFSLVLERPLETAKFAGTSTTPTTPVTPSSRVMIRHIKKDSGPPTNVPPQLGQTSPDRDRYGFRKATSHVTIEQYDTWNSTYEAHLSRRHAKWFDLLRDYGLNTEDPIRFPPMTTKMKRYVRKGIPPEYRGAAWFWYSGAYVLMQRNPGLYETLVAKAFRMGDMNEDMEHIERDLHRTFPDNIHFKSENASASKEMPGDGSSNMKHRSAVPETNIVKALRRLLYAFSLHNPEIGYTQSLNFLAGLFLLFLPEDKAFWMLCVVTSNYLPGTHEISLEGANIDLWILMVVLKDALPSIYAKISPSLGGDSAGPDLMNTTRLPDITLGLTNWLMSLFLGTLPTETALRVWDVFFTEGSRTFFRVGLAIFRHGEKEILKKSDMMEVFQTVQAVPKSILDVNTLLEMAFARKLRLSQGRVEELRLLRKGMYRRQRHDLQATTVALNSPSTITTTISSPKTASTPTMADHLAGLGISGREKNTVPSTTEPETPAVRTGRGRSRSSRGGAKGMQRVVERERELPPRSATAMGFVRGRKAMGMNMNMNMNKWGIGRERTT